MAKQAELTKRMCKGTGQRQNRLVWNNVQRVNHQNQFFPTAVLTRTGRIPVNTARASCTNNVNTARHNFNSQAAPTNAAKKVNIVKPIAHPTLLNIKTIMVALLLLELVKMCDKKNKVLFTDTECLVLSPDFKLPDENQPYGLLNFNMKTQKARMKVKPNKTNRSHRSEDQALFEEHTHRRMSKGRAKD
ncbi:hypothetical protein Tco_1119959 [Tanacetum coccineum]